MNVNIRFNDKTTARINKLNMVCHRYMFVPLDAVLIYTHFLKRRWDFMCSIIFQGDGQILVADDVLGEFDGVLEDLGISYYTEDRWLRFATGMGVGIKKA